MRGCRIMVAVMLAASVSVAWAERPLPLPWAKTLTPSACVGRPRTPFKGESFPRESYCRFIHCRPPGWSELRRFTSHQSWRGGHGKTVSMIAAAITRSSRAFHGAEKQEVQPHSESEQHSTEQQPLCPCHRSRSSFVLDRDSASLMPLREQLCEESGWREP